MKLFDKVNIILIIQNHLATLKNDNSKKPEASDYFTFLFIPIVVSAILIYFKVLLSSEAINILITTLSILVGLLFNVIVLIFDIIKRDASNKTKNLVLKELFSNISFTILISILTITFTLFTFFENSLAKVIFTGIVYFLLSLFMLTVLMILKRMHKLFSNEIAEIEDVDN